MDYPYDNNSSQFASLLKVKINIQIGKHKEQFGTTAYVLKLYGQYLWNTTLIVLVLVQVTNPIRLGGEEQIRNGMQNGTYFLICLYPFFSPIKN